MLQPGVDPHFDKAVELDKLLRGWLKKFEVAPSTNLSHYNVESDVPVFFYGGWGSNFVGGPLFCIHPFTGESAKYETNEHWLQANKAPTFEKHELIRRVHGPGRAKMLGQKDHMPLTDEQLADWDERKYEVHQVGLREKFVIPMWRKRLLDTDRRPIAEDSPSDAVWGIRSFNDRRKAIGWDGTNLLGIGLMHVREEIR